MSSTDQPTPEHHSQGEEGQQLAELRERVNQAALDLGTETGKAPEQVYRDLVDALGADPQDHTTVASVLERLTKLADGFMLAAARESRSHKRLTEPGRSEHERVQGFEANGEKKAYLEVVWRLELLLNGQADQLGAELNRAYRAALSTQPLQSEDEAIAADDRKHIDCLRKTGEAQIRSGEGFAVLAGEENLRLADRLEREWFGEEGEDEGPQSGGGGEDEDEQERLANRRCCCSPGVTAVECPEHGGAI